MIGPEDLEDSPPPAEEVEAEKEEDIGEVVEIGEVKEVEEIKEVPEVKEAEVVTEVEAKGDTDEEPTKVEEVAQVLLPLCSFQSIHLFPTRWNSLLLKLRRSSQLLLRMMTLHLNSWSLPLHLPPLQLNPNLWLHLPLYLPQPLCLLHLNLQQPHPDQMWLLPGLKLPLPDQQPPWKKKYATHSILQLDNQFECPPHLDVNLAILKMNNTQDDEEDDDFDETLSERLIGLTEMFPQVNITKTLRKLNSTTVALPFLSSSL